MLWYLHFCADSGIEVTAYEDEAESEMIEEPGAGRFREVVLRLTVTIGAGDPEKAKALHTDAGRECFIANSLNFPVCHEPVIVVAE